MNQIHEGWSSTLGAYRFFRNAKVTESSILSQCLKSQPKIEEEEELYVLSDTSQINLNHLQCVLKDKRDLGVLNDGLTLGYSFHGSIVLDTNYRSKGISFAMTYNRPFPNSTASKKTRSTSRDDLRIEEKESYRWLLGVRKSTAYLGNTSRLNFIFDREGDIYEMLDEIDNQQSKFIVRVQHNRRIKLADGGIVRLKEYIESQGVKDKYRIRVSADGRANKTRIAELNLKYSSVKIMAPTHYKYATDYRPYIEVSIIQVKEQIASTEEMPDNFICWNILTNSKVESIEQAKKKIEEYSSRWCIEDVFRGMKNKGLQLDSLSLENGKALRKIAIMAFDISTVALQLRQVREGNNHTSIEEVFESSQIECLKQLSKQLEGKTQKLKNPHSPDSLAWAAWVIARLGGWKGYKSQRPPGIITMKRGLEAFSNLFLGWSIRIP